MMEQQTETPINLTQESESCATCNDCANVFSSIDFGKFLSQEFPLPSDVASPFLSKDNSLPSFDVPSLFKSKDTFSQMFASNDWQMKFTKPEPKDDSSASPKKTIPTFVVTPAPQPDNNQMKESLQAVLSSRDWMATGILGPHVDVSINSDILAAGPASEISLSQESVVSDLSVALPPVRTDWDNMFFSQMQLMPPQIASPTASDSNNEKPAALPMEPVTSEAFELPDLEEEGEEEQIMGDAVFHEVASAAQDGKKKRKRKPRKKVVPEVKQYLEPKQNDVLLGRGGRSNHHPGNKRYREEVKNLRTWYLSIGENKDEKTALSQCLVDYVHSYKGRFLEKDKNGWYEVPNIVARRKASQALREDDDPEKRAAKRARFLRKKAAQEEGA